jgi:hypothetical protein
MARRGLRWTWVLGLGLVLAVAALLAPHLESSAFPDAPDSFRTYDDGQLSFRHPADWRVARVGTGAVTVSAPSGRGVVVVRRTGRSGRRAMRMLDRRFHDLTRGRRESTTLYELELPGRGEEMVLDEVWLRAGQRRDRIESLVLPDGAGGLVHFMVRGPVTEDPATDPRAITGTLRFRS